MNRKTYTPLLLTFLMLLSWSCAQDLEEDSKSIQKRILEAYINTHHPGLQPSRSGIYLIDSIPGSGPAAADTSYVLVDYAVKYLDGTHQMYTSEETAKQLGTYSPKNYYGPKVWDLLSSSKGIVEICTGMKEGGYMNAIVPPWLIDEESKEETVVSENIKIYDIWLRKVIANIVDYEIEILEDYSERYYAGVDSIEKGLYLHKLVTNDAPADTLKDESTFFIRYVGKYLNGKVFDTNIADTAKKHGIYNPDGKYEPSIYTHYEEQKRALENNSFVKGFTKAIWNMNKDEKAITFFYSRLGYGEKGNGSIPGYTPLCFEIWVKAEDEEI